MSELKPETLAELLAIASQHNAIVVDFYANWCGPCKKIAPYVEKKCKEFGVVLVKVDVDVNGDAATKYSVQAMPTFSVLDRQGNEILKRTGGTEGVVNEIVAKAVASLK
jgi:thioredoxin 1